jgi:phosphoglycolate phosphatase-like HAD superfamily hydrolase
VLPGVRETLEMLAGRGDVTLGLLTGNLEAGAWAKLEAFGLADYFEAGGFSSDHADRREIARRAHAKLCAHTGIPFPAARTVVVGDTEHDVDCAQANGFRAVAVASGWVPRERLVEAGPDALLDDFTDSELVLAALDLHAPTR